MPLPLVPARVSASLVSSSYITPSGSPVPALARMASFICLTLTASVSSLPAETFFSLVASPPLLKVTEPLPLSS